MKKMPLANRITQVSRLVYGCDGLGGKGNDDPITDEVIDKAERAIEAALSIGITMFDLADIYKAGKSETVFGYVLKRRPELRDHIILQTKCGIRFRDGDVPHRYDFSEEHIVRSVEESLRRLGVETLDVLLLHRPDPLADPEEVGQVLVKLKNEGKVRHFGVSNMNAAQIRLLQSSCSEPLIINQLEMNLLKTDWVDQGVSVNQSESANIGFADGLTEFCMLENIQLQAWSSLARGVLTGAPVHEASDTVIQTKRLVQKLATEKETSEEAIVLGWLMKHPAFIQPLIGSTDPERIRRCGDALKQAKSMSREEWYSLYTSARGRAVT